MCIPVIAGLLLIIYYAKLKGPNKSNSNSRCHFLVCFEFDIQLFVGSMACQLLTVPIMKFKNDFDQAKEVFNKEGVTINRPTHLG